MIPAITASVILVSGLFFAQLIPLTNAVNMTNVGDNAAVIACRETGVWTFPTWPTDITLYCQHAIYDLVLTEWEVFQNPKPMHDFVPEGEKHQHFATDPVRLPCKFTAGPCTLALTTLKSVPTGYMPPEIPKPPYAPGGYTSWHDVWVGAKLLYERCVNDKAQAGMLTVITKGQTPGLGLFLYATDSQIDKIIGQKVNGVSVLPVVNRTDSDPRIISNTATL